MKEGDKIIWNSGFGYELGTYISDKGVMYDTVLINLETGVAQGKLSVPIHQIIPRSKKALEIMLREYPRVQVSKTITTLTH